MLFPAPVPPTKATIWFGAIDRSMLVQDRLIGRVTEADVLKTDRARRLGDCQRVRCIDHVILAVEHLEASLARRRWRLPSPTRCR